MCSICGKQLKKEVIEWSGSSGVACDCSRCWPDRTNPMRTLARGTLNRATISYCEACEPDPEIRSENVSRHMKVVDRMETKEGHFADINEEGVAWADVTADWNSLRGVWVAPGVYKVEKR